VAAVMIEIKNIHKSFNGNAVLKNISAVFESGKVNMIIGASGSGKSVLIKCITGLVEPDSGNAFFDGSDFTQMDNKTRLEIRKQLGFLFQYSALFDSLTVEENVMFPLRMFTDMKRPEMLERVNFCLNRVHINNKNQLFPSELSGGMQKRVGIARAIALNPKFLFCDEPNSGLDPQTSIVIDNLIKEITLEYNMTTIVVSHDMNSVIEVGDHISFIYKGELWWQGGKKDLINTDNKEVSDFVYSSDFMKILRDNLRQTFR
jgi:phospholipid/cholesterol/gamma-HCH transport system ATP-binding protein